MALSEASKEAIYLKNILSDLIDYKSAVIVLNDNQSARKLSLNPVYHKRSKHIDVRHHFVREAIQNGQINVEYIPTDEMLADILTKGLNSSKHSVLAHMLGLGNI